MYNKQCFYSCSWAKMTCFSIFMGDDREDFCNYFHIKNARNDNVEYVKSMRRFSQNTLGCGTLHTRKLLKNDAYIFDSKVNIDALS